MTRTQTHKRIAGLPAVRPARLLVTTKRTSPIHLDNRFVLPTDVQRNIMALLRANRIPQTIATDALAWLGEKPTFMGHRATFTFDVAWHAQTNQDGTEYTATLAWARS